MDVYGKNHSVENGKDGITFDDGDARLLVINSATRNHAGRYFCTATIDDKSDTVEGSLSFESMIISIILVTIFFLGLVVTS